MQLVNADQIRAIVNSTNSFSKEVMEANRELIKTLRAEKKARLMQLTPSQIGTLIEHEGLTLVGEKRRTLKNGVPVVTLTLRGTQDERAKLLKEKAKIEALLAKLNSDARNHSVLRDCSGGKWRELSCRR
jgi:hypothetical protein